VYIFIQGGFAGIHGPSSGFAGEAGVLGPIVLLIPAGQSWQPGSEQFIRINFHTGSKGKPIYNRSDARSR